MPDTPKPSASPVVEASQADETAWTGYDDSNASGYGEHAAFLAGRASAKAEQAPNAPAVAEEGFSASAWLREHAAERAGGQAPGQPSAQTVATPDERRTMVRLAALQQMGAPGPSSVAPTETELLALLSKHRNCGTLDCKTWNGALSELARRLGVKL